MMVAGGAVRITKGLRGLSLNLFGLYAECEDATSTHLSVSHVCAAAASCLVSLEPLRFPHCVVDGLFQYFAHLFI
jgi:hypothetical protein